MWTLPRSPAVRVLEVCLLGVLPVVLLVGAAIGNARSHKLAYDFDRAYTPAIHHVLHGMSPYGPSTAAALSSHTAFVYPPLGAFLGAPLALFPAHTADILVTVLAALTVPAILLLVGVRDWRCIGASLLWLPTISAIHLGTVSLPMALGVALMWRWRDRPLRAGVVLGLVIALKLFLWPLVVWLAITRRYKAAAVSVVSGTILVLVPWIPLGGAGLLSYPHRLNVLTGLEAKLGFSPAALLAHLGVGWSAAEAVGYALGISLLVWAYRRRNDEAGALALICAASLLLTPILWPNYLVIMLVPLAVLRPRFGIEWLLPVLLLGESVFAPPTWEVALLLGVLAALTTTALGPHRRRRPHPALAWER
jgi:Glycosyltransferase family 87